MANSQEPERKRLNMVIKSRAYKIGSKRQEFTGLKLYENKIFGCGYSTKDLTRSRDQKSTTFGRKFIEKNKRRTRQYKLC